MRTQERVALLSLTLAVVFGAEVVQAAMGEVLLFAGMASGTYGTGSESDVVTSRVVFNTGDKYQFKVDAGWIRVESEIGILPSRVGPLPMQRRRGSGNAEQGAGSGPASHGSEHGPSGALPPPTETEDFSASGVGDVYFGFSRRIVGGGAKLFRMDGGVEVKAPTADADQGLGTGEWDARIGLSGEYHFWSATGFAGLGWNYLGDPAWVELNNVVDGYAGIESEPLGGRVILSGWLAGNPEVIPGVGSRGVLGFGLRTAGSWRFRLQGTAGLTEGAEDFSVLLAVSRGVPTPTVGTRGPRR